jgi:hypothetical protein
MAALNVIWIVVDTATFVAMPAGVVDSTSGATQMFDVQIPEAQSPAPLHFMPSAQCVVQLPPQSTSVSLPFWTVSEQVAAEQV